MAGGQPIADYGQLGTRSGSSPYFASDERPVAKAAEMHLLQEYELFEQKRGQGEFDDSTNQETLLKFIADQDIRIQQLEKLLDDQSSADISRLKRNYEGAVQRIEEAGRQNRDLQTQLANAELQLKSLQEHPALVDELKCEYQPKLKEQVDQLTTELTQKTEQVEYLTASFTEYREYAEEKMECKGMAPSPDPWKIPSTVHEQSVNDDEENQFAPQLSYQLTPHSQLAPQSSQQEDKSYITELQIENGKFREGIILRNKKIKLLENVVQARDAEIRQLEQKEHAASPSGEASELRT